MENKFVKILDEITVEGKVEFLQKVAKCKTAKDVVALVNRLGREISLEEAEDLLYRVKYDPISFATPLTDEALDDVAGGCGCGDCSDSDACGDYLAAGACWNFWNICMNS